MNLLLASITRAVFALAVVGVLGFGIAEAQSSESALEARPAVAQTCDTTTCSDDQFCETWCTDEGYHGGACFQGCCLCKH